jgi:hypothetical protein
MQHDRNRETLRKLFNREKPNMLLDEPEIFKPSLVPKRTKSIPLNLTLIPKRRRKLPAGKIVVASSPERVNR